MSDIKFAAIGINHAHIYGQVDCLKRAGAQFVAFHAIEDDLAKTFGEKYPEARRVSDPAAILEDASIQVVVTAAIPGDRADICLAAMRHGKDVLTDKPGMTTFAQLDELKRVQKETGRIYSVLYSEHFEVRATVEAGNLIARGAIGKVINTVGLGPHAIRNNQRPDWFFDRQRYGGILCDIGSHQFEQFLTFSGATDAVVTQAAVANYANHDTPEFEDFGEASLTGNNGSSNYIRVDWFTPDGLSTWGDGRTVILGTKGYIELRKYVDVAREKKGDHVFLVDDRGEHYLNVEGRVGFRFFGELILDCLNRTEKAMTQAHAFKAAELCLYAQAAAKKIA
jgi:predicted dehydrogenase